MYSILSALSGRMAAYQSISSVYCATFQRKVSKFTWSRNSLQCLLLALSIFLVHFLLFNCISSKRCMVTELSFPLVGQLDCHFLQVWLSLICCFLRSGLNHCFVYGNSLTGGVWSLIVVLTVLMKPFTTWSSSSFNLILAGMLVSL